MKFNLINNDEVHSILSACQCMCLQFYFPQRTGVFMQLAFSRISTLTPFLFYSLIHYLPSGLSTVLPVQCDRCWAWGRVFLPGRPGCKWVSSQVFYLLEFGLTVPAPTFLGTQPPYVTKTLTYGFNSYLLCQKQINPLINQSIRLKILSSVIHLPSFLNCLPISYTLSIPPTTSI